MDGSQVNIRESLIVSAVNVIIVSVKGSIVVNDCGASLTALTTSVNTSDTSNSDDAKRSRIIINSDADETMFEIDVKKEGTGDDAKSEVIFKNRGAAATPAFMTVNNTQDVTFGANVSIPNLAVSGTTTTINSTVTTYVESAAGVKAGGRTGMTSLVIGLLFIYKV